MATKATKARSRRSKLMPTQAIGTPFRQAAVMPEPVNLVGDSGTIHGRLGDNPNGPEVVDVRAPAGPLGRATLGPGKVKSFAPGGTFAVGSMSPAERQQWEQTLGLPVAGSNNGNSLGVAPDLRTPGSSAGVQSLAIRPPGGIDPVAATLTAERARQSAAAAFTNAQQQTINASRDTLAAGRATLGPTARNIEANRQSLLANQRTFGPAGEVIDARGNVLDAQGRVVRATDTLIDRQGDVIQAQGTARTTERGFIRQQQGANEARLSELEGIQAAQQDVGNLAEVARGQVQRQGFAIRYAAAGLQPIEIVVPPGFEGDLPPGVLAKIETNAEILQRESNNNEARRAIELDNARLIVALAQNDVTAAQLAAARAGLTVDRAQQLVARAQLAADRAGLTLDQFQLQAQEAANAASLSGIALDFAQLNQTAAQFNQQGVQLAQQEAGLALDRAGQAVTAAGTPPAPGLVSYTDPRTGRSSWMLPVEADILNTINRNQGVPTYDPSTQSYVPAPLGALSDSNLAMASYVPGSNISAGQSITELVRRGYSRVAAEFLVTSAKPLTSSGAPAYGTDEWGA